ncbi:MAG: hypothetical protein ACUVWP_05665 [bacterium]
MRYKTAIIIFIILLLLTSCKKQIVFGRPEMVKEELKNISSDIRGLNEEAYQYYKKGKIEMMNLVGFEILRCINYSNSYINVVSYYEGTINPMATENDEFRTSLWKIDDELSSIVSGSNPTIAPYVGVSKAADENIEIAKKKISETLDRVDKLISKLPVKK